MITSMINFVFENWIIYLLSVYHYFYLFIYQYTIVQTGKGKMFCSLAAVETEEVILLANFIFRKYEEKDTMIYEKLED